MDDQIRRYNVERSCLRCHERKVRCDKGAPCSKCVRLGVTCQYPGPRRVKRRPPKTTVTDVVTRLEQLERSIATLGSPGPSLRNAPLAIGTRPPDSKHKSSLPSSRAPEDEPSHHGILVNDGSYIDEPLLSRVLEKDKELQSAIGSPSTGKSAPRKFPPLKVDGIITNPHLITMDLKALQPDQWQATMLWHTFVSRVDPVLKVLHIPTTVTRIFGAISRPESQKPDIHCLLFAIFFGATTARCSDEPENEQIRADLRRYQQGLELAMHHSNFLDCPTVPSLQAMAIYLTCLRYTNSGRSGFTLRGLAIRAAQSIGLHRDGKYFKLKPLECELRRRLWWTLYTTDARMAEDHGITVAEKEFGADVDFPTNIDDLSVSEDSVDPAQPHARWTEMSFSLIITEINKMWIPLTRATSDTRGASAEQLIKDLKTRLHERYLQYGDMDIPIQRQGMMVAQVLVAKAEIHTRQKILQMQGAASSSVDQAATAELLGMAVNALELGLDMHTDKLLHSFRWLTSTYTQFHLLTYILWHLCVYPTGAHVKQAWRGVNRRFDLAENDASWPDPGPKWPMLVQLRRKALRIRQAHGALDQGDLNVQDAPVGAIEERSTTGNEAYLDLNDWDLNWLDFPDWNYLAQSIAIMGR
ncbi:uncharacterized protein N7477_002645 [Penicillium maclennaniae]|uniref:uncharacterized protein n=1 Tax=Penicillium maclennaniae TaxID=1343394 RepID=UPI002541B153|nr:uncharacterized protein N7477_002645 [Penicillium maclennaniae]KAJ5677012.1 hypothetical protein N7477_002645 [Penicillium maclennaniae]